MNNEFSFGSFSSESAVNTSKPQLKPYNSYKVKYVGSRIEKVTKKDDANSSWDCIKIRFEGDSGYYEHSVFFIQNDDNKAKERPKFKNAQGREYERPSQFENTMTLLIQLATILNEDSAKKFQAFLPKCKSFEDVANAFIKVLEKDKNKELYIKLLGRVSNGAVYATLPACCGLSREGERFPINVFSKEDNFNWSAYELGKKAEYENAKPTPVKSSESDDIIGDNSDKDNEEDIDFDSLL